MKTFPNQQVIRRYMVISILLTILGIIIVGRAAYTMFAERTKWAEIAKTCVIKSTPIPVNRGNIISADGQLLATYVPEYKLYMDYNIYCEDSVTKQKFLHRKDSLFFNKIDSIAMGLRTADLLGTGEARGLYREAVENEFCHYWSFYLFLKLLHTK